MGYQHCDPDEAVRIFQHLSADFAFACHWGTFRLTDEPYDEPRERLAVALEKAGLDPVSFAPIRRALWWNGSREAVAYPAPVGRASLT